MIGKTVIVTNGIHKDKVGKVAQQHGDNLTIEFKDGSRGICREIDVVSY